ncbi:hypothetical protein SALWKB29_2205 [Snodgrassella communis]|uniref:Uncharacterized protein n=1 Tax=Snodgrassella communis TaxID=2946699 RepID=A0A836MMW4_9NEIS|nr:hypothetical protein SALWKB29_2205 [Snodgrassella communis]
METSSLWQANVGMVQDAFRLVPAVNIYRGYKNKIKNF